MRRLRLVLLTAAVVLLAGCAEPGQVPAGGSSPTPSVNSTTSPTASPTGSSGPAQLGEVTVRGTVQEGVETGCLLLAAADGTQYLLIGGDPQVVRAGASVVVVGRLQPGMVTTCQQGTPLVVVSAQPDR